MGQEAKIVSVFARVARAHLQVKVTKQQIHDMERTTKKRPPSTTTVQTIYSGYEEHDVSELDNKSVFSDLMPFPKQGHVSKLNITTYTVIYSFDLYIN
jgi:hypothetical protein